ncbi:hypothetical protein AXG55_11405 [Silvanigrella aquatica]|uniref:Uncharacterized protein n=1 Tax=Silvanigrella aquatica TaxID=1915309 RepID=A0A1L4D2R4_9BACT|nr:hypothetical protein AXG55_11405 [Silvanigrella aquatica]
MGKEGDIENNYMINTNFKYFKKEKHTYQIFFEFKTINYGRHFYRDYLFSDLQNPCFHASKAYQLFENIFIVQNINVFKSITQKYILEYVHFYFRKSHFCNSNYQFLTQKINRSFSNQIIYILLCSRALVCYNCFIR